VLSVASLVGVSGVVESVVLLDAAPVDALPAPLAVSGLSGGEIESTPGIDSSGGGGAVVSFVGGALLLPVSVATESVAAS
jgi:hypothetical protein